MLTSKTISDKGSDNDAVNRNRSAKFVELIKKTFEVGKMQTKNIKIEKLITGFIFQQ